jgi:hypothetical protein
MIRDHRTLGKVIALGILISLLSGCGHAPGGEGTNTKPVLRPRAQLHGEPSSDSQAQAEPGDVESGWHAFGRSVVDGFTSFYTGWKNPLKADQPSDAAPTNAAKLQRVILGKKEFFKKVASEERTLIKGVRLELSRASTLERGVSLSREFETLFPGNIGVVVKAELGARMLEMLGDEIRRATTTEGLASIDGNVWEKARIDWYAQIYSGNAILEINGVTHEVPFEYTIGFRAKVVGITERRPVDSRSIGSAGSSASNSKSPVDPSARRVARVTTVSTYNPDLFEARFETEPAVVEGDKLPVFRGDVNTRCIGYCEVVAIRGSRIVGRCDGFRPKVGDFVGQLDVAHGLNQSRR